MPCHEARQRRYRQTDKGRAQHRRSNARYEATYKGGASRIERNLRVDAKRHREVEELHGIR